MEAAFENEFCNLQIHLSFFDMLSNRIQNYMYQELILSL